MPTTSRLYSWAAQTSFSGTLTARDITDASTQYRESGGGSAWLLDASSVTWIEPDAIREIEREVRALNQYFRLNYIAVVLPWIARPFFPDVSHRLKPVVARDFGSREEALGWMGSGCK
jgi:hypothetical protein